MHHKSIKPKFNSKKFVIYGLDYLLCILKN